MTDNDKTPKLYETRDRVRRLRSQTSRLQTLEKTINDLDKIESQSESLSCLFSDFVRYDLTGLSDMLEKETSQTGDPEVWPETEDLINTLDRMTGDLRRSLSDFLHFMESQELRLSLLFSETADHIVMSSIMEIKDND